MISRLHPLSRALSRHVLLRLLDSLWGDVQTLAWHVGQRVVGWATEGFRVAQADKNLPARTSLELQEIRENERPLARHPSFLNPSGDANRFAGHVLRVGRRDVHRRGRNVVWLPDAPKRRLRFDPLAEIAFVVALCVNPLGFDQSGVDGVDANLARAQFFGEDSGNRIDGSLGG